jgi:glucose-1-phosphate cytidylyltransferase
MVEIGGKPILWHILKLYSHHGINDFIICCGYKGYVIKEYFANYFLHTSDVTFDMQRNEMVVHEQRAEPWTVTLVDTGDSSMTGGRIKRIAEYVQDDDAFCLTYGDGVCDVDITQSIAFHRAHGRAASLLATPPPARFGVLEIDAGRVNAFHEKPKGEESFVNGGFFVLSPRIFDYLDDDFTVWERDPLMKLAADGELMAFPHDGFWHPMDTLRDKVLLEELWASGRAPWKKWD